MRVITRRRRRVRRIVSPRNAGAGWAAVVLGAGREAYAHRGGVSAGGGGMSLGLDGLCLGVGQVLQVVCVGEQFSSLAAPAAVRCVQTEEPNQLAKLAKISAAAVYFLAYATYDSA